VLERLRLITADVVTGGIGHECPQFRLRHAVAVHHKLNDGIFKHLIKAKFHHDLCLSLGVERRRSAPATTLSGAILHKRITNQFDPMTRDVEWMQINGAALVFHELATNAAKYGAFMSDDGTVKVSWSVERILCCRGLTVAGGRSGLARNTGLWQQPSEEHHYQSAGSNARLRLGGDRREGHDEVAREPDRVVAQASRLSEAGCPCSRAY
jgi:hypothetical protein